MSHWRLLASTRRPTASTSEPRKNCGPLKAFKLREMARPDVPSGLKTWLAKADAEFGRYALAFHLIEWAIIAEALENTTR